MPQVRLRDFSRTGVDGLLVGFSVNRPPQLCLGDGRDDWHNRHIVIGKDNNSAAATAHDRLSA